MTDPMVLKRVLPDEIERGTMNLESGEFPMTLATDGEASDGHILNIDGAVTQTRMPLLFNHWSSESIPALGSVVEPRKDGGRLRATGRFNMNGEDTLADLRRGIAQLVNDGDLRSVSVRWEGIKQMRRTALPENHPAYVKPGAGGPKEWGVYFDKWRALEGSVVWGGADPKALIGRAQSDQVRAMLRAATIDGATVSEAVAVYLAQIASCVEQARGAGLSDGDIANAVAGHLKGELREYEYGGGKIMLPREAWDAFRGASLEDLRLAMVLRKQADGLREEATEDLSREVQVIEVRETAERQPAVRTVADMSGPELTHVLSSSLAAAVEAAVRRATGRLR